MFRVKEEIRALLTKRTKIWKDAALKAVVHEPEGSVREKDGVKRITPEMQIVLISTQKLKTFGVRINDAKVDELKEEHFYDWSLKLREHDLTTGVLEEMEERVPNKLLSKFREKKYGSTDT